MKGRALLSLALFAGTTQATAQDRPACGRDSICGPINAEDLERVSGTPWVIASSVNGSDLYRIDARNGSWRPLQIALLPKGQRATAGSDCASAPTGKAFAGHGIAIRQGARPTLYAVNHARDAIEIFEIDRSDARLTWRGCVRTPADMMVNGVAPLPGGGLAATKYATPGQDFVAGMAAGMPTGDVRIWFPDRGWRTVAGSETSVANGIAATPDGATLYVAVTGTREIWRIRRPSSAAPHIQRVKLDFSPDNLRWNEDGRILTTGFNATPAEAGACFASSGCTLGYTVAALDPRSLKVTILAHCPGGGGFGNASGALRVGKEIWIGTFRGSRVGRLRSVSGSALRCPEEAP